MMSIALRDNERPTTHGVDARKVAACGALVVRTTPQSSQRGAAWLAVILNETLNEQA
jgi:hypothetical protein